jgi:demethylmenaquinone methyltransferase / 2-methoxy-6-polyprenyl-1,4-benzoquinol methylase
MGSSHPGVEAAHRFFSGTGPSYDLVAVLCTAGFDFQWKSRMMDKIPSHPRHIVDQACGTGILSFRIAARFPACRVTGVELRDEYLAIAKKKAVARKAKRVDFILGRAEDVRVKGPVDCITSSYLAKYAEVKPLIQNAEAMLRSGGVMIMHDFTYPVSPFFLPIWKTYFKILQTLGSTVFPQWITVFHELPEFLRRSRWLTESIRYLKEHDFSDIRVESLTLGTSAIVTATRP